MTCLCGIFISKFIILILLINVAICAVEEWPYYGSDFKSVVQVSSNAIQTDLVPGVKYNKNDTEKFHVFCFKNVPKSTFQIWRSVQLVLLNFPEKYYVYHGANATEVRQNYKSESRWHPAYLFSITDSSPIIAFPAFSKYCIGIHSPGEYSFFLKVRTVNYWKFLMTFLGIFFFFSSPELSRNSFFHYAAGVTFGVLVWFFILLFILSRLIPRKSASLAVVLFGSSFACYFLKLAWHHFNDILANYLDVVLVYCLVTAFLSFVVCYRLGPVENERTRNLIQWSMQALSLIIVFFSSEYRELSTAISLLLLTVQLIPIRWIKWIKYRWYKCFPPKIKLLTEVEYIEQGHLETKKALDNLRNYCNSPDCNVWRVVRQLKDPVRFANFIEKGSHYTDQELLDYNSEDYDYLLDLDEDTEY